MLTDTVQKNWEKLGNQVPAIAFNSGRYNLNLVRKYFVE